VIAVDKGVYRALTNGEEAEFQHAMYGTRVESAQPDTAEGMLTILLTPQIGVGDEGV
jgi:hypothetical protein